MLIKTWRFITIILTALNLGMAFCHLLQLPPRMGYDAALWMTTTHTLFPLFAVVSALIGLSTLLTSVLVETPTSLVQHRVAEEMRLSEVRATR